MKTLSGFAFTLVFTLASMLFPAFAQQSEAVVDLTYTKGATAFQHVDVMRGTTITLRITSDTADILHVGGYNKRVKLVPNKITTLTFVANKKGRFDFGLEKSKEPLGIIRVQ